MLLYIIRDDGTDLRVLVRQGSEGQPIGEAVSTADWEEDAASAPPRSTTSPKFAVIPRYSATAAGAGVGVWR